MQKPDILALRSNEILTAVIHGARKEETSSEVQLAAIHALFALALAEDSPVESDPQIASTAVQGIGRDHLEEQHSFTGREVLHNPEACVIALRIALKAIKNNPSGQDELLSVSLLQVSCQYATFLHCFRLLLQDGR